MNSSPLELIVRIYSSIQEIKQIYEDIAPIKNTLLNLGQRKRISELQEKI